MPNSQAHAPVICDDKGSWDFALGDLAAFTNFQSGSSLLETPSFADLAYGSALQIEAKRRRLTNYYIMS